MKGITENGFKFSINDKALNNMELVEAIAEVDHNTLLLPRVLKLLLGEEQKKALYDFVRDPDGTVPMDQVATEVEAILHALGEKEKN